MCGLPPLGGVLMITLYAGLLTHAQVTQDHPELCGRPGTSVPIPAGLTFSMDPSDFRTELHDHAANKTIPFPAIMQSIPQVCPVSSDEAVVFGLATPVLYNLELVRVSDGTLLDSFYGYTPLIAPNQRWLSRRKFYPAHAASSEEYLIYDLTQDWAYNREPGIQRSDMDLVGKVIYPAVAGDWPFYNVDLPNSQTHTFRSDSFYWAPDSNALIFADSVDDRLSLVLVTFEHDAIKAYTYGLNDSEACPGSTVTFPPTLSGGDVSVAVSGRREIHAGFRTGDSACKGTLTLQSGDFKPAAPEVHSAPWGVSKSPAPR
jgi:hypothetical protein